MDRSTLLAISLILIVLILPTLIFAPAPAPAPPATVAEPVDSQAAPQVGVAAPELDLPRPAVVDSTPAEVPVSDPVVTQPVVVASPLYRFSFSPVGARLVGAELLEYRSFTAGDSGVAQLIPTESGFLSYRLVFGDDTVSLADWHFEPSAERVDVGSGGASLTWVARRGPATIRVTYSFRPDDYRFDVRGEFEGIPSSGVVIVGMGPRLRSTDSDSIVDFRSYGLVTKNRSTDKLKFTSLNLGESRSLAGPFEWVAIKSKYFLAAILAVQEGQPQFGGAQATGGPRTQARTKGFLVGIARRDVSAATEMNVLASLPVPAGSFGFSMYVGPQEYRRLSQIGHELEDVNPYGWILRPIIGPLSIIVVRLLLWMHETLNLAYGWVLVLFGVAIRLALWPLNQKAMRSQMAMQALQPEMKAIQERYKNDRAKLQQEMMKLYKHHGASPLGGCLPILLQMPILFTLFFVFLNTIELRGVPFLWLPDLSLADPLFIIPLVMGGSMFALSKIGQIGVPPNPQTKMMVYVMPAVFTMLFLQFSSGLNLYYATSNLTSLPQQWMVAQERLRRAHKKKTAKT
jgi:YidC/Oxa1 family membrane protein insertase